MTLDKLPNFSDTPVSYLHKSKNHGLYFKENFMWELTKIMHIKHWRVPSHKNEY